MDYTVHGILQARILEWVAVPFSRGSSQSRDWTQVSRVAGRFFTSWATREARVVKNPPVTTGNSGDAVSIPGVGRFYWRRKWQPTPVCLPGKFHGQKSGGLQSMGSHRAGHNWARTHTQIHGTLLKRWKETNVPHMYCFFISKCSVI